MLSQIDLFYECFDQVDDPRVVGRTKHPLNSILFLVVAAFATETLLELGTDFVPRSPQTSLDSRTSLP